MHEIIEKLQKLIQYSKILTGDEKGEAQVFCDRLFQAFGHEGYKEAGAILEYRVQSKKNSTRFADLLWSNRVLIEMKKRGAKLESHRTQAFDYWWNLRPASPEYVILCNFDEFIIYDFSRQDEPLDKFKIDTLLERYTALNFLFPIPKKPLFDNNLVDVTKTAAAKVVEVFNRLIERGEDRERAQRFTLQIVFAMFAEDIRLLPYGFYTELLNDCKTGADAYDLLGGLFRQMANKSPARGGRYKDVAYFNGGLFAIVDPIELNDDDVTLLREASKENWRKVHPGIFGTIFQNSMGKDIQHIYGAHFTYEIDIYKIVYPTIVLPWRQKIEKAKTLKDLQGLRKEILQFNVLDPACGSGNFLYIAYRELKRLEIDILNKIHQNFGIDATLKVGVQTLVSPKQFHGLDINFFAIELAKVTLMLAKELSIKEAESMIETQQLGLQLQMEAALPLDNLDANLRCADALFTEWPKVDVIIGNPPFQSKNKMQEEFGAEYVNKVRSAFPEVPGRADFCVYWFHKAHRHLRIDCLAGLVGTKTIRENYSREGSLDYIVNNGGTIFNAVSSQDWPGEAAVDVSIVCWKKGEYNNKKLLYASNKDGSLEEYQLEVINSSLSLNKDVVIAQILECNRIPKKVFQGQTHGHKGFLLSKSKGLELLADSKTNSDVLKPFLIGDELLSSKRSQPKRFVIDFTLMDINKAASYKKLYKIVEDLVYNDRKKRADKQELENKRLLEKNKNARTNKHHLNFFKYWWKLSYGREDMLEEISKLSRYIACSRVSKRPIFEFISTEIRPNDAMMVFCFDDDYSFGIIQSSFHWEWWKAKCSTLEARLRYTTNSVWDTFAWPQNPSEKQIELVANYGRQLRELRNKLIVENGTTLRNLYRVLDSGGSNSLADMHSALDARVSEAYGFSKKGDILTELLSLNLSVAEKEKKGENVQGPGLPKKVTITNKYISKDSIKFNG